MKKGQFSYMSGRALSHASLQRFRQQNVPTKMQIKSNGENKQTFNSRPKYYINVTQNNSTPSIKIQKNPNKHPSQTQQQLKKKIKVLQYELKNKINENSYMVKIFKTKNSSQLSHLDIYLEMRKLEADLQDKIRKQQEQRIKIQQCSQQIQQLLVLKQQQESRHTLQVTSFLQKLQKLQKKHRVQLQQKQKQIQQQRKIKQQKDILLKQIRKKYEGSQKDIADLQEQLQEQRENASKLRITCQERIQRNKQDYILRIEEINKEIQQLRSHLRQSEQIAKENNEKYNNKQLQRNKILKKLQNQLNSKSQQYIQKQQQAKQLSQKLEQLQTLNTQLQVQITSYKKEIYEQANQIVKNGQSYQNLHKQLNNCRQNNKETETKYEKLLKQASKMEQKVMETASMIKMMQYQREEKEAMIDKLKSTITDKQAKLDEKSKYIQQLQCKTFNLQRKSTSYSQRVKQLQKQFFNNKQLYNHRSKLEIQNYKSIGRLMELIHQLQLLIPNDAEDNNQYIRKNGKGNVVKKGRLSDQDNGEPGTITQCIDMLTKYIDSFIKLQYQQHVQESKTSKQLIHQIISDIKSIFHAYNSYIQDQQLKGATREYLECLDSQQKSIKKSRGRYLQVILERLISMVAIQSYTSEKGIIRQSQQKKKYSTRRLKDSLDNTCTNWTDNEEQNNNVYYDQRNITKRESRNSRHYNEDNKYIKGNQSRRKSTSKLNTEPVQMDYPSRRLQYGKQNMMQRLNRNQNQPHKFSYLSQQQKNQRYAKSYINTKEIGVLKRFQNIKEQQQSFPLKREKKVEIMDKELIEKKYFR